MHKVVGSEHSPESRRNTQTNMVTVVLSAAHTHKEGAGVHATQLAVKTNCVFFLETMSGCRYW